MVDNLGKIFKVDKHRKFQTHRVLSALVLITQAEFVYLAGVGTVSGRSGDLISH